MTQQNNLTTQPVNSALLGKRMLLGAGIALILITVFLLPFKNPDPAWGKLWMIRPFIIVPLAGAVGGACNYFLGYLLNQDGRRKALTIILSLVIYIIGIWMGFVLGFAGTLWN